MVMAGYEFADWVKIDIPTPLLVEIVTISLTPLIFPFN
jgi:di/tricarboxylate transporter